MVSDAKKKANAKWDKANMMILGCRVRRSFAADFRAACAAAGTTPNAVLKQAAEDFMQSHPMPAQMPAEAADKAPDPARAGPKTPRIDTGHRQKEPVKAHQKALTGFRLKSAYFARKAPFSGEKRAILAVFQKNPCAPERGKMFFAPRSSVCSIIFWIGGECQTAHQTPPGCYLHTVLHEVHRK